MVTHARGTAKSLVQAVFAVPRAWVTIATQTNQSFRIRAETFEASTFAPPEGLACEAIQPL